MLEAIDLAAGFGAKPLFQGLNLQLVAGQTLGLSGRSGSGKTTLARVLAGLHPPQQGQVRLMDSSAPTSKANPVQYLHQTPLLAMNPRWRGHKIVTEAGPFDQALATALGVETGWLSHFPHELSGGQLQRLSLLRALAAAPRYLIADEITAALDPVSQREVWQSLSQICQQNQIGLMIISHDPALLGALCHGGILSL